MSPVEKPVVIPLEYHLIDNEFNNINNQQQQNHHHHDQQSQDQHQQQSDKIINDKKYFKNHKNNHNLELNETLTIKNQIINSNNINNNNNNNENDNITNKNHDDQINENSNSANEIYKINNDTNNNCNNHNNNTNNENENHTYPKCNRNRQLFGIQLEVTSLLLEAERRKLNVLQKELKIALEDSGSVKKAKENFKQELILAISRIQSQYDLLEKEYKQHAIGRLRNSKTRGTGKSNRSQPAIGLKQTPKARPTIFGTVASDQSPKDNANKRALPQTTAISSGSFSAAAAINRKTNNDKQNTSSSGSVSVHVQISNNIEKEKLATDENSLVYRDGNLISGPLDALIQHMVPTSDYYPDRSYIFAFLLSARLFIRPYKLLEKICQLCEEQQNFKCKLDTTTTTMNNEKCYNLDLDCNFSNSSINSSCSGLNDTEKTDCDHHHHHHHQQQQQQQHKKDNGDDEECCRKLKKFAQNFIQLLAEWIDTFPYDFRDERLMQHVRLMSKKCICIDNNLRKDVSTMLQNLLHRLTVLDKYEEFLQSISNDLTDCPSSNSILLSSGGTSMNENRILGGISSSTTTAAVTTTTTGTAGMVSNQNSLINQMGTYQGTGVSGSGMNASGILHHTNSSSFSTSNCLYSSSSSNNSTLSSIDISELCPIPTLLAHQLTHIELERLSHIGPEEFVQAFAKENPHLEQSFNDIKKTRNLESYIQWFNRLSYFVATEIVRHCKKKQRVRIVEYWIETARECFNIGNFNSLMAIIAGLNMSPISRLKKTWAKVQLAKFSVLEHQMDPSSNFNSYRSTLKAAMWRSAGATDERERIVIPFFSLLVKDLYFLNEGCSNKLENGHVNFEKFWQLAKQVTEFIAWKQVTCPFEKIPKVIMFLYTNHILNENMLALASFECEPPENHEKDRYKCLKSEQQQQLQQQQQQQHHQHQQQ